MTKCRTLAVFCALALCASTSYIVGMAQKESSGFETVSHNTLIMQQTIDKEFPGLNALKADDFFQTDWLGKVPATIFYVRSSSDVDALLKSKLEHWKKRLAEAQSIPDAIIAARILGILYKIQEYVAVDKMSNEELDAQFSQYGQQRMMQSMILSSTKEPEGEWGSLMRDFLRYMIKQQIFLSLKQEASRN